MREPSKGPPVPNTRGPRRTPAPIASLSSSDPNAFAAGFLYGYTRNLKLADCGRLGSLAAAEVISHIGARPETPLVAIAQAEGLVAG